MYNRLGGEGNWEADGGERDSRGRGLICRVYDSRFRFMSSRSKQCSRRTDVSQLKECPTNGLATGAAGNRRLCQLRIDLVCFLATYSSGATGNAVAGGNGAVNDGVFVK